MKYTYSDMMQMMHHIGQKLEMLEGLNEKIQNLRDEAETARDAIVSLVDSLDTIQSDIED